MDDVPLGRWREEDGWKGKLGCVSSRIIRRRGERDHRTNWICWICRFSVEVAVEVDGCTIAGEELNGGQFN